MSASFIEFVCTRLCGRLGGVSPGKCFEIDSWIDLEQVSREQRDHLKAIRILLDPIFADEEKKTTFAEEEKKKTGLLRPIPWLDERKAALLALANAWMHQPSIFA